LANGVLIILASEKFVSKNTNIFLLLVLKKQSKDVSMYSSKPPSGVKELRTWTQSQAQHTAQNKKTHQQCDTSNRTIDGFTSQNRL